MRGMVPTENLDIVCPYKLAGEGEELRYMARSVARHFPHATLWLIGDCPSWVDKDTIGHMRNRAPADRHQATTAHIRAAVESQEISDPFILFNDDFYCLRPMEGLELLHRGNLAEVSHRFRSLRSRWGERLRITETVLNNRFPDRELYSYDLHVPLLVHKEPMRETLDIAQRKRVHKRTVYGNIADLGGRAIPDPKYTYAPTDLPTDGWLSSEERSFGTAVQPILQDMFPDMCVYERVAPEAVKRLDRKVTQRRAKLNHSEIQSSRAQRAAERARVAEQMAVPR